MSSVARDDLLPVGLLDCNHSPGSTRTDRPSVAFFSYSVSFSFFVLGSLASIPPVAPRLSYLHSANSTLSRSRTFSLPLPLSVSLTRFLLAFLVSSHYCCSCCCLLFFLVAMEWAVCPFSTFPPSTIAAPSVRSASVRVRALPSPSPTALHSPVSRHEEGDLDCPRWAGDDPLSRFVSSLIAIKPLFNIMKAGARQVLIGLASLLFRSQTGSLLSKLHSMCCCILPCNLDFAGLVAIPGQRRKMESIGGECLTAS